MNKTRCKKHPAKREGKSGPEKTKRGQPEKKFQARQNGAVRTGNSYYRGSDKGGAEKRREKFRSKGEKVSD